MKTFVKTPVLSGINNINAAYSWLIGNDPATVQVHGLGIGEVEGIHIPHFLPISGAGSCFVTLTYKDVTGSSGTIFSRTGIGAISGTTPVYYPVRDLPCNSLGLDLGSLNTTGVRFPLWGRDLILTIGSIGSPNVTFSGVELIIEK
jgi:hypothetical protein